MLRQQLGFQQEWAILLLRHSRRFRFNQNDQVLHFEVMQHQKSQRNSDVEWTAYESCQAFFHDPALEQDLQFRQTGLGVLKQGTDIRNTGENPVDDSRPRPFRQRWNEYLHHGPGIQTAVYS